MINKNSSQILVLLLEGISLINRGDYFNAHETLEIAWRMERKPIRILYQGLIQLSVACYHTERKNWIGAGRVLTRAMEKITPFVDTNTFIDLSELLVQMNSLDVSIKRLLNSKSTIADNVVLPQVRVLDSTNDGVNPGPG